MREISEVFHGGFSGEIALSYMCSGMRIPRELGQLIDGRKWVLGQMPRTRGGALYHRINRHPSTSPRIRSGNACLSVLIMMRLTEGNTFGSRTSLVSLPAAERQKITPSKNDNLESTLPAGLPGRASPQFLCITGWSLDSGSASPDCWRSRQRRISEIIRRTIAGNVQEVALE